MQFAVLRSINSTTLGDESQQNFVILNLSVDYVDTTERTVEDASFNTLVDMGTLAATPPSQIRTAIKNNQPEGFDLGNAEILMAAPTKASLI